jgi:hypothetical protein
MVLLFCGVVLGGAVHLLLAAALAAFPWRAAAPAAGGDAGGATGREAR